MFHELFYSVLNHGLRLAFAALPAMPLLGELIKNAQLKVHPRLSAWHADHSRG